jgi:hypothetical protein
MPTARQTGPIRIQRIGRHIAEIPVTSTAPLITHRFDEKAKLIMFEGMQGKKRPREPKDPDAEYRRAYHRLPDGSPGFPAAGFKAAIVDAARLFDNKQLTMVLLKQAIFVLGEGPDMLVPILGSPGEMREDHVRLNGTKSDLRYRPMFDPWHAILKVLFPPSIINLETVISLVDAAGFGGVGEWRPTSKKSNTGVYGTFTVEGDADVQEQVA